MKNTSFNEKQLKYAILKKMEKLPYREYQIAKNKLPIALKVSKRTFENWMSLRVDDKTEVSADKLALIAKYLGSPLEDMFNYPIPQYNLANLKKLEENKFAIKIDLVK